ncbi:SIR2-like domain-containing protein [Xylaria digitata]|nr:SIR2-like domain-containing protein [Xylaria digitata]
MTGTLDTKAVEYDWPLGGKLNVENPEDPWANQNLERRNPDDISLESPGSHHQNPDIKNPGDHNLNGQNLGKHNLEGPENTSLDKQILEVPELRNPEDVQDQKPDIQDSDAQNDASQHIGPRDPNSEGTRPKIPESKGLTPPSSSPTASHPTASGAVVPGTTTSGSTMSSSTISKSLPSFKSPGQWKANRKQHGKEAKEKERQWNEREKKRKENESARVQEEAVKRLREQLRLGRLAICVGSNVTLYSASSQAERLSWWGFMSNALDYLEDQGSGSTTQPINQADVSSARKALQKDDPTEADRERVSNKIQKILASRGDLETTWMKTQFQNLYRDYVEQYELLDAIKALHEQGATLLTTNYDDCLENHCDLEPIDASDPGGLISYQRGSRQGVFHAYGYWGNACHVVLSSTQYIQNKKNEVARETLQHILATKTVLFVGYGIGSGDENFGPLFEWIGEKNVGAGASHYILLQGKDPNPITHLPLIYLRRESYDGVSQFLTGLLDPSERREGTLTELPHGRERVRIHNWLAPTDQSGFLNDMWNLHGPNRFDRQVTQSQDIWTLNTPSRVRLKGEEGWGKTMFCTSVIQHTLKSCRLGTLKRARDSLAYFFCATYRPYIDSPEVQVYDFNVFLRTVISQLCSPETVFAPLRALYADCTRYHPARQPRNAELEAVLIGLLQQLNKSPSPKKGNPILPGETYLVVDELEALSPNMRGEYSKFIKIIASLPLEHFHLLVTAEDPLTLGIDPPPRHKEPQKVKGKKGKSYKAIYKLAAKAPAKKGATDWAEVTLDWTTTGTAANEWLRDRFNTDPSLANYVNIHQDLIFQIHGSGQNLRWVYWKLNRLAEIGAAPELDDAELKEAAEVALDEVDDEEDEDGVAYSDDETDDDDDVLPSGKRAKEQENSGNKRRKKSP